VLQAELDMYAPGVQEEPDRVLQNDMQMLADFSKMNENVDFAGRIIWSELNGVKTEVFNFGKYKGRSVAEVLRLDPGYYSWILAGDFTYNTKQVLTRIRLREAQVLH
jgi:DNA polymerase-3 subunit epsilon